MNRWILCFAAALLICSCALGCKTAPTPIPVDELEIATEAAADSAGIADTVSIQADSLANTLESLPVPADVKTAARIHADDAKKAAAVAQGVVIKVEEIKPAVEMIAVERDEATIEIERVTKQRNDAWIGLVIILVIAVAIILRKARII